MTHTNRAVDDAARAVLDGTPIDWSALESSDDEDTRGLAEQLKLLSAVASLNRGDVPTLPSGSGPDARPKRPAQERSDAIGRWGHLELLEQVGSGAFGEVYRAWDSRLDREVALKLLPAGSAADASASPIIEEGRLLAKVRHPNVATIYGAESLDGRIGLWTEFVHGRTFEQLLCSGHQFSHSDVVEIGLELCHAVSAVHAAGLVHRDIKAQNVMRADGGRVVLMDFGTGRELEAGASAVAGTPLYLAPEVFQDQPATVQTDVYSVGVLLYHLLTGTYPVRATTLDGLRNAHQHGESVDLQDARPDLPPLLVETIRRAVAHDPMLRYRTCDALAADLSRLRHRSVRRRRQAVAALVAAGLAAAGGLWWTARGGPGADAGGPGLSRANAGVPTGLAAATLAPDARPMIAVVPFRNLRSEPDDDLIVEGFTYELIRNLAIVEGLDVRSATSSFALTGRDLSLADIGRQLGVNLVLEGSVQGSGSQWRIQAQFARVAGDTVLWSRTFDAKDGDALAVQNEIAVAVVNELRLSLGGGQRRYDLDPATYRLYLRARALAERRGTTSAEAAIDMYEQVIASDPTYAPAHAGLADAYSFMSQDLPDVGGLSPEQAVVLMRPAALRALDLDPLLAEAHAAMGFLYAREQAWDAADHAFRRALELNPSLTHVSTTYALSTLLPLARFDEIENLLNEALRRDPFSTTARRDLAHAQICEGRQDEAIRNLERVRAVDPDLPYVDLLLGRALALAGRFDDALAVWDPRKTEPGWQHWMAYTLVRAGRRAEVERLAAEHRNPYRLALIYTALGDRDRALEALDRAANEAPHRVVRLLTYPELAPLRDDPRFAAIRAKFRLPS